MAEQTKDSKRKTDEASWPYAALVGIVIVVLLSPVIILAGVVFLLARGRLRRWEATSVAAAALAVSVVRLPGLASSYWNWAQSFWSSGHGAKWAVPVIPIAVWALFVSMTAVAVLSTERGAALLSSFWKHPDLLGSPSILPSDKQRRRVSVAAPAGGLVVDPTAHSVVAPVPVGQRELPIGIDSNGVPVTLSEQEIKTHGLVLGATGSGKTETLKALVANLLDLGWDVLMLDLKEDTQAGGLRDFCREYAHSHAMPYQELALSDPRPEFWFNTLQGLGPDEARDTILSLMRFDDEHWQNINKKLLGELVNLFYTANQVDPAQCHLPTMHDIGKVLSDPAGLPSATKKMRATIKAALPGYSDARYSSLSSPSQAEVQSATGFGAKLVQLYATQAGMTVLSPGDGRRPLDVTLQGLAYVGLDTMGKPDLTQAVSAAVLQRISVYAAERTTGRVVNTGPTRPKAVIVDEAGWVNRGIVMNLLTRARSAGFSVWLATQSANDWPDEKGDDWPKMTSNTNCAIIMKQGEPVSAEICAAYIGKKEFTQYTAQVSGGEYMDAGSARSRWDYIVQPDEVRSLGVGEAVLRVGSPANRITWMKVIRRNPSAKPATR